MKTFYATTPIYYVNDLPHIGHIYSTVVTDVITRFHRLIGEKTRFLTGTDEHGQNIEKAAAAQGVTPIQLADRVVERYHELYRTFEIANDDFIRTTEVRHRRGVEALIARIAAAGDFYTAKHEGWYCSSCEAFYTEKELDAEKRCPVHGTADGLGVRGERLLPTVEVRGAAPRTLREASRVRPAGEPSRRGRLVRARRPERPLGLALEGQVGDPVSGTPGPRRLRLARRPRQLHHGARLRLGRRPPLPRVLGPRGGRARSRHRQGHPALPRRLLAGLPDVRRAAAADDGPGARLVAARREEDVEVRRQHRAPGPARRRLRARRPALLPDARDGLRPGRLASRTRRFSAGTTPTSPTTSATRSRASPRSAASRSAATPREVCTDNDVMRASSGARAEWQAAMQDCQFNRALETVWQFLGAGQRLRRRAGALEDPQGRRRRLGAPPSRALRRRRGRAPLGRDALAVRPGDLAPDLRGLRARAEGPDLRRPRLGPAPDLPTDAGDAGALSARRRRGVLQGKG